MVDSINPAFKHSLSAGLQPRFTAPGVLAALGLALLCVLMSVPASAELPVETLPFQQVLLLKDSTPTVLADGLLSNKNHIAYDAERNARRPSQIELLLRRELALGDDVTAGRVGFNLKQRAGRLSSVSIEYRLNF